LQTGATTSDLMAAAGDALQRHWAHSAFRAGQKDAVEGVLRGQDVLAVLPTGGGKSVCYQVPAVVLEGLTIVVSPLIALMQDQVAGLRARGIPATFINSQLPYREAEQRWTDSEFGMYRLLYLAPERLTTDAFRLRAERLKVRLLAVDEAHCISEWGPDFRPAYRRIAEAIELLGRPPVIAVTATATPEVRRDIIAQLGLRQPRQIVSGFDRPNVIPSIFQTSAKQEKLEEVLRSVPGSAVVYVSTRALAESTAARLRAKGISSGPYHAGLPAADRMAVQESWQRGDCRVIAATNAFGMGIDKPDVRAVIHLDVPFSLEAYYQEAGRAGRDGATAYAALLFAESDERSAVSFIEESRPESRAVQAVYDAACSVAQIATGSEGDEPFIVDVEQVATITSLSPMTVRAAAEVLIREGVWEQLHVPRGRGLIRFLQSSASWRAFAEGLRKEAMRSFVQDLMRTISGEAYHGWTEFDIAAVARRTGLSAERLLRGLDFLAQRELVAYHPPEDGLRIRLTAPRSERVHVDAAALRRNRERAERRLKVMLRYVRSGTCRRHFLLSYFGEAAPSRCGTCDVCLGRHRVKTVTPEDEAHLRLILEHVRDGDPSEDWLADSRLPVHRVLGLADWLVHEGYMRLVDPLAGVYELTDRALELPAG
jgi:ATP-dependent DNA helicase RecQ